LSLQAFLGVTLLTFLVLAAILAERKRAEEALRASEERFRVLAENAQDVIYRYRPSPTPGFEYISPAVTAITGFTPEEYYADPNLVFKCVHPDDRLLLEAAIRSGTHSRTPITLRWTHKDGTSIWIEERNVRIHDKAGNPVAVEGVARDITERKRAEEALARHAREMEALYETSLEINSQPDVPTLLRAIVRRATKLLGTPMGALHLARSDDKALELVVSHNLPSVPAVATTPRWGDGIAGRVAQTGEPVIVTDYHPSEDQKPSDAESSFRRMLGVPLKMANRVIGVITVADNRKAGQFDADQIRLLSLFADQAAIAVENARLHQLEREQFHRLQESQAQLVEAEKMAAVGRLVGSIAHEINNPLQALQNSLTLVNEELEDNLRPGTIRRYLDIAEQSSERIAIIMRRVRDFYRPSRQSTRLTDIRVLLESVLGLVADQLQSGNVTVKCEWKDHLPLIRANQDHLGQVFLNLVMNAIDAMSPQGGSLRVRTTLEQIPLPGNRLLPAVGIEFRDTGMGIPTELLRHLFEPFATTQPGKASLGLSISYAIIQAHGGQIKVESQAGIGTTFTILLPVEETPAQP
jgi:two-component system NtrC family sensor kinase